MEENKKHITYPVEEELKAYLSGSLSSKRMREIELLAQSDPLLADAIEGFREMPAALSQLNDLKQAFLGVKKEKSLQPAIKTGLMAAGFLLLLGAAYFVFVPENLFDKQKMAENLKPQTKKQSEIETLPDTSAQVFDTSAHLNGSALYSYDTDLSSASSVPSYTGSPVIMDSGNFGVEDEFVVQEKQVQEKKKETIPDLTQSIDSNYDLAVSEEAVEMDVSNSESLNELNDESVEISAEPVVVTKERATRVAVQSASNVPVQVQSIEEKKIPASIKPSGSPYSVPVTYLNNLKVIDYRFQYEKEENKTEVVGQGTSAEFANRMETDKEGALRDLTPVTYWDELKKATFAIQNTKYDIAIESLKLILNQHSEDENALFYTAFSYYQLYETGNAIEILDSKVLMKSEVFGPESKWYLALSYERTGDFKAAKKTLKKIVRNGGFYAEAASKKLNELEN